MIISASRRCDIPAFYPQWFLNRLREGRVLVPNPRNPNRCSSVSLRPEDIDCIVFWTKNPIPLLPGLDELDSRGYPYYFQFTLTPYGPEVEGGLPPKLRLEAALHELGERLGPRRVVWRYDPILLSSTHTTAWHKKEFERMCASLAGCTCRCVISFLDLYPGVLSRMRAFGGRAPEQAEQLAIAHDFSAVAAAYGIELTTCCEHAELEQYGIRHGACIDEELIEHACGSPVRVKRDPGQREDCRCVQSVDIGAYGCCAHRCLYCYARGNATSIQPDDDAPMITGYPAPGAVVTLRPVKIWREGQTTLFKP